MEQNNILKDYYKAKLQLEILTLEVKEKQEAVLALLREMPDNKAGIPEAKFAVRKTPVYQFSEAWQDKADFVEKAKNSLKELQTEEIKTGVAKVINETMTVVMIKNKA